MPCSCRSRLQSIQGGVFPFLLLFELSQQCLVTEPTQTLPVPVDTAEAALVKAAPRNRNHFARVLFVVKHEPLCCLSIDAFRLSIVASVSFLQIGHDRSLRGPYSLTEILQSVCAVTFETITRVLR